MIENADVRRRWRTLTPDQVAIVEELVERAEVLREASDGELSVSEAIELAAQAVERIRAQASRGACARGGCPAGPDLTASSTPATT